MASASTPRRRPLGWLIAAFLALLVGGCAGGAGKSPPASAPVGETAVAAEGGIGGTGVIAEGDDRGIGGTGVLAGADDRGIGGTGIVGTITGFASILVNGLEVHLPDGVAVSIDGSPASPADLKVGQLVAVVADEDKERLVAKTVEVRYAVAGPIERMGADGSEIVVLGQRVRIPPETLFGGSRALIPGEAVVISGLRSADGVIFASRIDPRPPGMADGVRGTVTRLDASGFNIGGLRVETAGDPRRKGIAVGRRVSVWGGGRGTVLRAQRTLPLPSVPFGGRVRNLSIEGYVSTGARAGAARIGGLAVDVAPGGGAAASLAPGHRVVVEGRLGREPGVLRVQKLRPPPFVGGDRPRRGGKLSPKGGTHRDRGALHRPSALSLGGTGSGTAPPSARGRHRLMPLPAAPRAGLGGRLGAGGGRAVETGRPRPAVSAPGAGTASTGVRPARRLSPALPVAGWRGRVAPAGRQRLHPPPRAMPPPRIRPGAVPPAVAKAVRRPAATLGPSPPPVVIKAR